jgi:hypothetical protein
LAAPTLTVAAAAQPRGRRPSGRQRPTVAGQPVTGGNELGQGSR